MCPGPVYGITSLLLLSILLSGLSACTGAQLQTAKNDTEMGIADTGNGTDAYWWYCRYQVAWPEADEVDLVADLLLAHAVVAPVLNQHRQNIPYWRFHRRAARDEAGHQFSFIFYASPAAAAAIVAELQRSAILQQALSERLLESAGCDDPGAPARPGIAGASDQNWPAAIQKNWPSYIMGVSATWLGLITDAMAGQPAAVDIAQLIEQYHTVDAFITSMWNRDGQHAFLHHLNAIFGYEPLLIRNEIRF